MFSKGNSIKNNKLDLKMDIQELFKLIKDNPNKEQISKLHKMEYGSEEYKEFKEKYSYITPHGIFTERNNKSLVNLSGYLYFDLDNTKLTKEYLINKYKDYISLISNSIGGRGLFFLVKIIDLNMDNFDKYWSYLRNIFSDLNIDQYAKGLSRAVFIPYDINVYYNPQVNISLSKNFGPLDHLDSLNSLNQSETIEVGDSMPNDTFSIIPMNVLKRKVITRTKISNIDLFKVEEINNYVYIFIPEFITDGKKHFYYKLFTYKLMYLNPDITQQEVFSFIYHINKTKCGQTPMKRNELYRWVNFNYKTIRNTNDFTFLNKYMKKKIIHFNMKDLTKEEKIKLSNMIMGRVKTNKTREHIAEVISYIERKTIEKPTQKNVVKYFPEFYDGPPAKTISIATVKRNWNKEPNYDFSDIKDMFYKDEIKIEEIKIDNKFDSIDEEDFFVNKN